jgi:MFS family permease
LSSRRLLAGQTAAFASFGLFWGMWAALLPAIQDATGVGEGQLGAALLAVTVGALPAMVLAGPAADRAGRLATPTALVAFALALQLPGLATSGGGLAAGLVVMGATSGALDVVINADAAEWEARGHRLMNLLHAAFSASLLAGSLIAGVMRELGADRRVILAVAGVAVLACVPAAWRTAPPRGRRARDAATPRRRRRFAPSAPVIAVGGVCALAFAVEGGVESWAAIHMERTLEAGAALASLAPALYAAAMAGGRLAGQTLGGAVSERRLLTASGLVCATGAAVAAAAPSPAVAIAGFTLCGLGTALAAPTLFGAAGRLAGPGRRATAMSSVTTVAYLGFLVSPALVGAVAEVGGLRIGLCVVAGFALAFSAGSAVIFRRIPALARAA